MMTDIPLGHFDWKACVLYGEWRLYVHGAIRNFNFLLAFLRKNNFSVTLETCTAYITFLLLETVSQHRHRLVQLAFLFLQVV